MAVHVRVELKLQVDELGVLDEDDDAAIVDEFVGVVVVVDMRDLSNLEGNTMNIVVGVVDVVDDTCVAVDKWSNRVEDQRVENGSGYRVVVVVVQGKDMDFAEMKKKDPLRF